MKIFVLEAQVPIGTATVLGLYSSASIAEVAAREYEAANRAEKYPANYDYYVSAIWLDDLPTERWNNGRLIDAVTHL